MRVCHHLEGKLKVLTLLALTLTNRNREQTEGNLTFLTCLNISNEQSAVLMPLTELTWIVQDQDETTIDIREKKQNRK